MQLVQGVGKYDSPTVRILLPNWQFCPVSFHALRFIDGKV